jgi:predicted Ser/Thr protein kinase
MDLKTLCINNTLYDVVKLLGKGKGGYSYLVKNESNNLFVLKQIHHEPCSYYTFGNKIEAEINDYKLLVETGIRLPKLIDVDIENERILKEYVDGLTIDQLIIKEEMKEEYLNQVKEMALQVKNKGLNIDYFPTNFVVNNDKLYYVDYECNLYMEEWNFENWGIKYWSKTEEFTNHFLKEK